MDDFENFEFIDFTTSGPWERFLTKIEDSLRAWGLADASLGVFDPATLSDHTTTTGPEGNAHKDRSAHGSDSQRSSTDKARPRVYQRKEVLTLDDASYTLSYQYHPATESIAAGQDRVDLDFLPPFLEGAYHHSLHRWTGLTHILIISPVTIPDIFASTATSASSAIIDLSSAKLLISSFAIAFQNTGCKVPIFVPTGQPWNLTFSGLMIQPQTRQEAEDDEAVEVRFNTVLVPYPPVQYTYLSGIMDFFITRMGINDEGSLEALSSPNDGVRDQIHVSALFMYDLVNWHDEDWRRWKRPEERQEKDKVQGIDSSFRSEQEPPAEALDMSMAMDMDDIKTEGARLSILPIPVLPFGPVQDPLKSMRLMARFASAPSTMYMSSNSYTDLDATEANIWVVHAAFKEDDYGILSGVLEDAISSWSSETHGNIQGDPKSERDQSYGSLLNKGARIIQGTITMVDAVDVENIVASLFEQLPSSAENSCTAVPTRSTRGDRLIPAAELCLHFRHATTVPYNSFLWRMIQYLVDVISPNSDISYATSIMGFLKVLWSELLKQFYLHWENSELIPWVDIYGEGCRNQVDPDCTKEKKPVAIDLRFNLLHQKLSMLNCCIARQIARNKDDLGSVHPVQKRPKRESFHAPPMDMSSPASEPTYGSQFHNLLHGLSDISRPKSADVVPMAKRFLETVKNRRGRHQGDSPRSSRSFSKTEPSSPNASAAVPIPTMELFRSRRRSHPLGISDGAQDDDDDEDDDDDMFYDPIDSSESSMVNPNLVRRAHSLTESFVALKYSSSADSQSGVLVSDIDQTSVNAHGPDPREVVDENRSEGGVEPLKNLTLLETGAPLLIPKLQEPGYMTEDMVQQQEELFETLGSSSDGAKMRAKMQSTQLISDMEAFKAANPGCVLGDFIRWHSPKDWVEDKGQMSARMADAGNYWQELWANSKRIPVNRQTPLFNHNQEAAKVLFYLDGLSSDQLFIQLLPTMCLLAYDTLVSHPVASHIRQVATGLKELAKELIGFAWNDLTGEQDLNMDSVIDKFREVELLMGRAIALVRKFPEQYSLVERILDEHEATVEDGPEREAIYDLFSIGGSAQSSFPQPTSREFVMETFDPAAVSSSWKSDLVTKVGFHARPLQRRMYACFKESEARIVEAVAKDGLYM